MIISVSACLQGGGDRGCADQRDGAARVAGGAVVPDAPGPARPHVVGAHLPRDRQGRGARQQHGGLQASQMQ